MPADVEAFRRAYIRRAALAIREAAPQLRNDLRANALNATGRMASAIRCDPNGPDRVDVVVDVEYASFTRPPGTNPHIIRGNPVLSFIWPGAPAGVGGDGARVVFASVQHPGFKPDRDWYGDVIDTWPALLSDALSNTPLD